jgi:hypothetical protein
MASRDWWTTIKGVISLLFVVGLMDGRPPGNRETQPKEPWKEDLKQRWREEGKKEWTEIRGAIEKKVNLSDTESVRLVGVVDRWENSIQEVASEDVEQVNSLWALARRTIGYLLVLVAVTAVSGIALLYYGKEIDSSKVINESWWLATFCVVLGTLGSAVAAVLSAADRVATGWELSDGTPRPKGAKGEKFNARLLPLFIIRPFLGAAMGFVVFAGVKSEWLIKTEQGKEFPLYRFLFLAILSGLFAKTLLDKLKDLFKALVGTQRE